VEIVDAYDIVLDCTDTPASRYLISDSCVILNKPLVSASALRTEGQLMILNDPPRLPGDLDGGLCYRCVFPKPPPAETVVSCGDGGILGPVVGVMGILQALEAIKVITRSGTGNVAEPPTLLLFSAYSTPQFRSIRLRRRKANCAACSASATVTKESLLSGSMDYVQFCGLADPVNLLSPEERITATEYGSKRGKDSVLIDVREKVQFDLCSLEGSINIPFSEIVGYTDKTGEESEGITKELTQLKTLLEDQKSVAPVYVICRLGNDSQVAVKKIKQMKPGSSVMRWIGDIKGGLKSWRQDVDPEFPDY
jgi:adenylyltransferase/sulfurtransferase